MKQKVLNFIVLIRKTFGRYKDYSGGCYKFHLILKQVFGGVGFYNGEHVITEINGTFYDIDGEVTKFTNNYISIGGKEYPYEFMNETFKEFL